MRQTEKIRLIIKSFKEVKFLQNKINLDKLKKTREEYKQFLLMCFDIWEREILTLDEKTKILSIEDISPDKPSIKIDSLLENIEELIRILALLYQTIGPVTFEKDRAELIKKTSDTIESYSTIFNIITGNIPFDQSLIQKAIQNVKLQSTIRKIGRNALKTSIIQSSTKPLPGEKEYLYKKNKFKKYFLSFNNHVWVLFRLLYLIVFLILIQLDWVQKILNYKNFALFLLFLFSIYILKAIRRKKFSIFLSGLIYFLPPLLWISGVLTPDLFKIQKLIILIKLFLWLTVLFWFPVQFLDVARNTKKSQVFVLIIIWIIVLSLYAYGLIKGTIVSVLLLIKPISTLLSSSKVDGFNSFSFEKRISKKLFYPTYFSFIFISFFVTNEGFWLIGSIIWIMFSISRAHSFRYFRRTYDLIEEIFPNPKGKQHRHVLLFVSLCLVTIILFPGFLGKVSRDLVIDIYNQTSGLAFGFISILLAVQAIIPGITTWAGDSKKANYFREIHSILRANAGLEGFMLWFFILFIYSIMAWFISKHFFINLDYLVDLTYSNMFSQLFELKRIFTYGLSETILVWLSTMIFAVFIYLLIYGIAQLFYLFIAANTLVLPIRDFLLSNPVEIEAININGGKDSHEMDKIIKALKENQDLNGQIVYELSINNYQNQNKTIQVNLEMGLDFIEVEGLYDLIKKAYASIFSIYDNSIVNVVVVRQTHLKFKRQKIFQMEINKREWDFLNNNIPGFPFDYKLKCLKAIMMGYVFAESQIA